MKEYTTSKSQTNTMSFKKGNNYTQMYNIINALFFTTTV